MSADQTQGQLAQLTQLKELVTDLADHLDYWERAEGFLWDEELKARVKAVLKE